MSRYFYPEVELGLGGSAELNGRAFEIEDRGGRVDSEVKAGVCYQGVVIGHLGQLYLYTAWFSVELWVTQSNVNGENVPDVD